KGPASLQQGRCNLATMASPPGPETVSQPAHRLPRWWRRTLVASRRVNLFVWLEVIAAGALVAMLISAWLTLSSAPDPGKLVPSGQAAAMLVGTLIPALALIVLAGRRIAIRRAGGTGARLHVNLVFFFALVAAIPTLFVAVFASVMFQSGVEFWFSDNQRGMLENANDLARGYYDDNQRDVADESLAMAGDLRFFLRTMPLISDEFQVQYSLQALSRGLSETAILQQTPEGTLSIEAIV